MKNKILIIAATLAVIIGITAFNTPQEEKINEYVLLKIGAGEILTVYPDGKTNSISTPKFLTYKNMSEISLKSANVVNSISKEGYHLVTSNGGDVYTTYIFEK